MLDSIQAFTPPPGLQNPFCSLASSGLAMIARFKLACALFASAAVATGPLYDYVVVGGGTSGLVVANRLSEDPDVSVVVIEAGHSVHNNENVTAANGYGKAFGTEIDYQYESVNQTYGGNSKQVLRAGKALGGTSTINGKKKNKKGTPAPLECHTHY